MESQVGSDGDCHLPCVYCSTYRAIEDFLKSDTKWFDMLLLGGQVRFCLTSYKFVDKWLHCLLCMHPVVSSDADVCSITYMSKTSLLVSDFWQCYF